MPVYTPLTNQPYGSIAQRLDIQMRPRRTKFYNPTMGQANQGGNWPVFTTQPGIKPKWFPKQPRIRFFDAEWQVPLVLSTAGSVMTPVTAAVRTSNGNSAAVAIGSGPGTVMLQLMVTAIGGTNPSLTIGIQWSADGTNFGSLDGTPDAFTAVTSIGNVFKVVTARAPYARLTWTITGTNAYVNFAVCASTTFTI